MKLFTKRKDGGGESTVTGYWLVEIKGLFSIALLKFDGASREAFHTHAFNCFSWVLRGHLQEHFFNGAERYHKPSWRPFITRRTDFHKVSSIAAKPSWILTFRGPWKKAWVEWRPNENRFVGLTHGRVELPDVTMVLKDKTGATRVRLGVF
jgi:hypothetical protein